MQSQSDAQLLRAYAQRDADAAFTELVRRHTNLVYSAALRQVESPDAAAEIAQRVFIGLARGARDLAPRLAPDASLAGWLCRSARNLSLNHRRDEFRRQTRERQAMEQLIEIPDAAPDWERLRRVLDDAMSELNEADYDALVLRFFQQQDFRTVGAALGVSDDTAQKRVTRALETLRDILSRCGIHTTTGALALVVSANAVQTAPMTLAKTISAVALAKGIAASGSTSTLIKGALKIMAWTKMKTVIVTGAAILLATGTATMVATGKIPLSSKSNYEAIFRHPDGSSLKRLEGAAPGLIIRPTRYPDKSGGIWTTSGRGVYVGADLHDLLAWAHSIDPIREIFPDDLPTGNYDYLNTETNPNEALREELKKQFGLIGRREARPTDVLILRAKNPARLNSFLTKGGQFACYGTGNGDMQVRCFTNASLSFLGEQDVQGYFRKPCIVRADLNAKYDFAFQWKEPKGLHGEARWAALRPVIEEQINHMGLELVPSREPVEMLVVEKTR